MGQGAVLWPWVHTADLLPELWMSICTVRAMPELFSYVDPVVSVLGLELTEFISLTSH